MKKAVFLSILIFCVLIISLFWFIDINIGIMSSKPSTTGWILENNEFAIIPVIDDEVTFYVENKQGKVVFISDMSWRCWDFKSINIDDDSTISIITGDMGTQEFYYDGETWYKTEDGFSS